MSMVQGVPHVEEFDEERLTALAKEYAQARDVAKEANDRKEAARSQILALVGDSPKVAAGPFFITVTEQSRTTIDTGALRVGAQQAGFDLSPFEKVSTAKVLRVVG